MSFPPKRDQLFTVIIAFSTLLLLLTGIIVVILLRNQLSMMEVLLLLSIFALPVPVIIWSAGDMKYVLHEDHLFLMAGIIRSRIPYSKIMHVRHASFKVGDFLMGFGMQASKDGLVIIYHGGFGEVKISPADQIEFLAF